MQIPKLIIFEHLFTECITLNMTVGRSNTTFKSSLSQVRCSAENSCITQLSWILFLSLFLEFRSNQLILEVNLLVSNLLILEVETLASNPLILEVEPQAINLLAEPPANQPQPLAQINTGTKKGTDYFSQTLML